MTSNLWTRAAFALSFAALVGTEAHAAAENPFFSASTLPYQAPRFDLIKDSDYAPAFERGMADHLREITAITNNKAAPTFENTIVAMEKSGRLLDRVQETFFGVYQANSDAELDKVESREAPRLSQHEDEVYLNERLFARVKAIYDARASLNLNAEQAQLLDVYYQQFVHAGAQLSKADKVKLRAINTKLANLESAYQQKLIAAAKNGALVVDSKEALAGLDDGTIASA